MEEAQNGCYKKKLKLNLQKDKVAGLLEWQSCNLQIDRACSLQELELQMSVLSREKKMQNNNLAVNEQQKLKNID